jgi:hypothetical protein
MSQDVEEYEFYEKRRLKDKMDGESVEKKREFLLGERTVAKNRMERLQEEVTKMNVMVELVKVMEKDLNE